MTWIAALIIFALAVLVQGLFEGYETGFVSANLIRIRYLAEEERLGRAARLLRHMNRPDQMLTTLLLGTNIAIVAGTIAVAGQMGALSPRMGDLAATLIVAPVFLIFAQIIPKSVFRTHPDRLSLALLPVIRFFYGLLAPLAVPVTSITRVMLRAVGGSHQPVSSLMSSLEDVRVLVDEGAEDGTIMREEQRMIHSVIDLQETRANEIMVPRIDIQALPETATRQELLALFNTTGRSRIPIHRETIDEVIGIVNVHDVMLEAHTEDESIARFVKPAMHVPDTTKVDDLFQVMKDAKQHLAIVTDEYGGTDGLITLEDILEEIFGEIQDEHDREERAIQEIGPDAYVIDARTPLEEAAQAIGVPLEDEVVETMGGWLMRVAGRIPAQGEVVEHSPFRMTVLDGGVNYISKIRLEVDRGATASDE